MAHYTILTEEEVKKITTAFNIIDVNSFKILSGGSENTNYLVKAQNEKYVLTICEQKTEEEARLLTQLLKHLEENNFSTSKIIKNKNEDSIGFFDEKPVMIKSFLEGKIMDDLPTHLIELIGIELGKFHKIKAPEYLPKHTNYGVEQFTDVEKYAADSDFAKWLKEKEVYLNTYLSLDLPKAMIHSDLFADNVIISEDEGIVTIMDFEEAANYYRIFDLGMTIIGICKEGKTVNLEKAKSLLKGYQKEVKLLEEEKKSLQAFTVYAATAMTFWRHRNFNYIKPDPEKFDHFKGLQVLADFIQELSQKEFNQII